MILAFRLCTRYIIIELRISLGLRIAQCRNTYDDRLLISFRLCDDFMIKIGLKEIFLVVRVAEGSLIEAKSLNFRAITLNRR